MGFLFYKVHAQSLRDRCHFIKHQNFSDNKEEKHLQKIVGREMETTLHLHMGAAEVCVLNNSGYHVPEQFSKQWVLK